MKISPEFWPPSRCRGMKDNRLLWLVIGGRRRIQKLCLLFYISGNLEVCRLCKITNLVTLLCFTSGLLWWLWGCCSCCVDCSPYPYLCYLEGRDGALGFAQLIWPENPAGARASALWPQLAYR